MRTTLEKTIKFIRLFCKTKSTYPNEIQIELTNACNLKCTMCPHTLGTIPKQDFPFDLFQQLLKKNPPPKHLVLTGWGEPLMHPHIFEMIHLTHQIWPSTHVRFTTNGVLLNQETQTRLFELNVSAVTVSVDCWPESDAWSTQWKDVLHPPSPKIHKNIQAYLANKELASKTPLILQSIVLEENREDLKMYIRLLSEYNHGSMNLVRLQKFPGTTFERMDWETEQAILSELTKFGKEWGVPIRTLNQQSLPLRWATHYDRVCMKTDDSLYITIDGTCTPCCNLRGHSIGGLSKENSSIRMIWNSNAENQFFKDQSPICGKCDALFHNYRD